MKKTKKQIPFEEVLPGQLVFINEYDELAVFERSTAPPEDTVWENSIVWVYDENCP